VVVDSSWSDGYSSSPNSSSRLGVSGRKEKEGGEREMRICKEQLEKETKKVRTLVGFGFMGGALVGTLLGWFSAFLYVLIHGVFP